MIRTEDDPKIAKNTPQVPEDEPSYDDDTLGATMMDVDIDSFKYDPTQKPQPPKEAKKEESEESVDELLKKQKSIVGRLGSIFGKK
jgi:hypothetical protein